MLQLDTMTCMAPCYRRIHHDKLREYTLAWIQRRNNRAIGGYITIGYITLIETNQDIELYVQSGDTYDSVIRERCGLTE